ncbi:sigma factor-like helix-turn-helix DNA-binding protein [Streptomyces sp. NPDC006668]
MTQNRIALQRGLSQMHVSRLITRTCARLRDQVMAEPRG